MFVTSTTLCGIGFSGFTDALERAGAEMNKAYRETQKNLWEDYRVRKNVFGHAALDGVFGLGASASGLALSYLSG